MLPRDKFLSPCLAINNTNSRQIVAWSVLLFCAVMATPSPAQVLNPIVTFDGNNGGSPWAPVLQARDGNLYGTTLGSVFKTTVSGNLTSLYTFCYEGNCPDGEFPYAGLVQGADGKFYGTASAGGNKTLCNIGCGTIFKITPDGTLTTIHTFGGAEGANPYTGLVLANDGNFYGTTSEGGHTQQCGLGCGTAFKITPSGSLSVIYYFCSEPNCADGISPPGTLIQGSDGNLYGTNSDGGGAYGAGTVFKLTRGGSLTTLYNFCSQSQCADGDGPLAGLVEGSDGNFYGTTSFRGAYNGGTVFKISRSGTLTTLHNFNPTVDGKMIYGSLVEAPDGSFYGAAETGGPTNQGTIFRVTPDGTFSVVWAFCSFTHCADGNSPYAGMIVGADGLLYGTTASGGDYYGIVYQLDPGLHTLSVATTGTGSVTSTDGYINCPGTCSHNYPSQAQVTLNATPASGWAFSGWGGACSGTGACQVTMTQNTNVSATFYQLPVTLTVSLVGSGSVASTDGFIQCPGTCQHTYNPGTPVILNATPASGWIFSGWTGACIGAGACGVTMSDNLSVTALFLQPGHGVQFMNATPCRLVDTRITGQPIQGGIAQSFALPQLGGCNIPANAVAYSLNVTVVPHGPLSYLTIWPTGEAQPSVSTMNSLDGRIKANAALVGSGTNGAVSVFVTNTSDVVLDIDGYFVNSGASTLEFYPLTPCRVFDTRWSNGDLGGPFLLARTERSFPIQEATSCGIPAAAQTYSLNVTAIPLNNGPLGYLTVWPTGQPQPLVSTLNDITGTVVANAAIVPAGTNGAISLYGSYDTNVVADINGYFAPASPAGLSLYVSAPCRVRDTRDNDGQPFYGQVEVRVQNSQCAPPATAQAYVFNATVIPSGELGYLTLWQDPLQRPTASTLNALDGAITSNMAIVPNGDGITDAYASGFTWLVIDISGYFAP